MKISGVQIHLIGVMSALAVSLSACSPTSENGLLTDQASQPNKHDVSLAPAADELYVKSDAATVYNQAGTHRADLSGECFTSTYPTHAIRVFYGTTQVPLNDVNINPGAANTAYCYQGRFNIVLNTSIFGAGSHSLKIQIYGIDDKGVSNENLGRGRANFTLTK
ncbi:hypothetical protein D3C87_260410 [compost metagenome]